MKNTLLATWLCALTLSGAHAQNEPAPKLNQLLEEFAQGANTCKLFLGLDDSGFDGLSMDYSEKLVKLLSNDTRTPRETYALIYQRCLNQTAAGSETSSGAE